MAFVFEISGQFLVESLAYGIGQAIAAVLLPHLRIEPWQKQKSMPPWKWRGITYEGGSHRYLYTESIQLLGLSALVLMGLALILMVCSAN